MMKEIEDAIPLEISYGQYRFLSRIDEEKSKGIVCLYEEKASKKVYMVKLDLPKPYPEKIVIECVFHKNLE